MRAGGVPARRAVIHWAWRLLRREWRQQILVLTLLAISVAAAVGGTTAAYSMASSLDARYGTADHRLIFDGSDPRALKSTITAAEDWFGTTDVISHRFAPVPGSVEAVELRAQDQRGAYGTPMLRLVRGRYPGSADEIAVTDKVAKTFRVRIGVPLALDGRSRTVVGLVENPGNLDEEFALVPPAHADPPQSVTILVRGSFERVRARPETGPENGYVESREREQSKKEGAAAAALGMATVAMLLVSLVAAAGFVVIAHRRVRQLGMLAAIGATSKHLRMVMLANGVAIGVIAALAGVATALVGWVTLAPYLESAAGHRIDRLDMPWRLIALGALLAVVTATAAAWWPARAVARIPVTLALSGRPPRPKPTHRSAILAAILIVIGVACLAAGIDTTKDEANQLLVIPGVLATILGVLFVSPLAVRALSPVAGRLPVAIRLALRDLARYQARSGAALAAIGLGLGIAMTAVITAAAAQDTADEGNLSDRQLLIRIGDAEPVLPERTPAQLDRLESAVDRFTGTLGEPAVITLHVAVGPDEAERRGSEVVRPFAVLARRIDENTDRDIATLYVRTPQLLKQLGLDPASIDPNADVLTTQSGDLSIVGLSREGVPPAAARIGTIDVKAYSSAPNSFVTPAKVRREGWETAQAGWLVEANKPLTESQLTAARDMAAEAGLTIESRDHQPDLATIRTIATGAGMLLALGILAMTVGLIRGESASELRTLTATGATGKTRRMLTGATAGALALLGVILGALAAYTTLIAGYSDDLSPLGKIPILHLTITIVGLPLIAGLTGWLLAGREPPAIARQPLG